MMMEVMVVVARGFCYRGLAVLLVFIVFAAVDDEIIAKSRRASVRAKPTPEPHSRAAGREPTNYTSTYHTSRKCGGSHGTPSSRRTSSSVRGTGEPGCVSCGTNRGDDASDGTVMRQCADSEQPILFA